MSTLTHAITCQDIAKKFKLLDSDKNIFSKFRDFIGGTHHPDELTVLDGVSFDVKHGEILGILGRNGAGKTTLLRLIANTLRPDRGVIKINGNLVPLLELGTGFDGNITARDNIMFYGTILGFKSKEIKRKSDEILRFAGLEDFANVKIKKFSSGMITRLAFSTAAQIQPDIMLVDEILSVGDLAFQQKSYNVMTSFKEEKKTIILTSHNLQTMRKICDRLMLLHNKKIASIGEPEKVIDDYLDVLATGERAAINTPKYEANDKIVVNGNKVSELPKSIRELREMVNRKEYVSAALSLTDMLKKEPENGYMHYLLAFCLHNSKVDYYKALHHYNLAIELGFEKFWVLYGRGSLQYALQDYKAARQDLEMAISLNPNIVGPHLILGQLTKSDDN